MKIDSFFTDNNIYLVKKNPLHFDMVSKNGLSVQGNKTFKDMFLDAISEVNESQLNVSKVSEQAILKPGSIDIHDITVAMAKATMNLNITKAIIDRSLKAYQDIINIR